MMPIPVERYLGRESLEEELEKIFWQQCFVAHESDIAGTNDYFSFRLGQRSLTLRRFESELALFDNVCRHRFNLIDPPGFGNRQFRCSYHGWTYGPSGEASFIPIREAFQSDPTPLESHPHRNVGGFVFKSEPSDVTDTVAEDLLGDIGRPAGGSFHRGALHHRCNWKLMVENVLEGYHLSMVHPDTFCKSGYTSSSRADEMHRGCDSLLTTYPHDRFAIHLTARFPGVVPGYRHLFVFPNLFVSVTNDLIYFTSNLFPIAPDETILHYRLFATQQFAGLASALQQHLRVEAIRFTETALNEDKEILERCQLGMSSASGTYALGNLEHRIRHFHESYLQRL
jgi:phenylpropionate dioxygenase-like ring-hydroxylating dioxygenase large terminal subunit